jgi:hypothetical protein
MVSGLVLNQQGLSDENLAFVKQDKQERSKKSILFLHEAP